MKVYLFGAGMFRVPGGMQLDIPPWAARQTRCDYRHLRRLGVHRAIARGVIVRAIIAGQHSSTILPGE